MSMLLRWNWPVSPLADADCMPLARLSVSSAAVQGCLTVREPYSPYTDKLGRQATSTETTLATQKRIIVNKTGGCDRSVIQGLPNAGEGNTCICRLSWNATYSRAMEGCEYYIAEVVDMCIIHGSHERSRALKTFFYCLLPEYTSNSC